MIRDHPGHDIPNSDGAAAEASVVEALVINLFKSRLDYFSVVHIAVARRLGELMSYFLVGRLMSRIARVGSRDIKWSFPTEDKNCRRR